MRTFVLLLVLAFVATPLQAQRAKAGPRDRIPEKELAEYGESPLVEVIERARPHFFFPETAGTQSFGAQTPWRVLVYIGSQSRGDTSILRTYRASEVKEIRYYKPTEANTRLGADNASVILLVFRDNRKAIEK